ncbi:MAG: hypothetical protein ACLR0U_02390 [Enterocloster clostridioformis]
MLYLRCGVFGGVAVSVSAMERLHGEEIHYESRTIRPSHWRLAVAAVSETWRMHGRKMEKRKMRKTCGGSRSGMPVTQ